MRMKTILQKLLMLIAMLSFSLNAISGTSEYDFKSDGIRYNIVSKRKRTVEVTEGAFSNMNTQANVVIPSKVLYEGKAYEVIAIEDYAFSLNKKMVSIEIPNTVKVIKEFAFMTCSNLKSVKMGEGVTTIENRAFVFCLKLTSIEIPSAVKSIGIYAFGGCKNLAEVYCKSLTPPKGPAEVFDEETFKECTLYVPIGTKEKYESADPWRNFLRIVEIDFSSRE